jgi:hypothetical protein
MTESNAQERQWRAELEAAGERAVRDNINSRGSLVTGGEAKQQLIRKWLREKDLERCANELEQVTREKQGFDYARWTFYVAVGALIAAMIGIIVTVLHA